MGPEDFKWIPPLNMIYSNLTQNVVIGDDQSMDTKWIIEPRRCECDIILLR